MAWNKRQAPTNLPSGFHNTVVSNAAVVPEPNAVCYYAYNQQPMGYTGNKPTAARPSCTTTLAQHDTTQPGHQQAPKPHTKRSDPNIRGGFQTVAVQAPGCAVQHFRICVGNDPDDVAAWIKERKRRFPRQKKLNDLLGAYGDSSDDDDDEEPQQDESSGKAVAVNTKEQRDNKASSPISRSKTSERSAKRAGGTDTSAPNKRRQICRYFANGTCNNGDKCSFAHENRPPALPNRLMDKLLEQERKREAALTLQLLFVLHNEFNYFQDIEDSE